MINAAEAIPYINHKDKFNIVAKELMKNRYVEVVDELKIVYSERKDIDGLRIRRTANASNSYRCSMY